MSLSMINIKYKFEKLPAALFALITFIDGVNRLMGNHEGHERLLLTNIVIP